MSRPPLDLLPPFPEVWDSSIRSSFVACPRQWYYSYLLSLRKSVGSIHLHFGGAMARGLEVVRKAFYVDHLDEIQAVSAGLKALIDFWGDYEPPPDLGTSRAAVKSLDAALDALLSYFEYFQLSTDQLKPVVVQGEALVEKSFALPVPGTSHPITGEPILYAGRFDMLAQHEGAIFVVDEKTTTSLGSTWRSNWPLRGQLTGYCWGARSFGLDVQGVVIRGIGVLKQSIQFEQAVLTRPQWMIDAWLAQLARDINRAAAMWQQAANDWAEAPHAAFDQAFDSACSSYGGCGYVELCEAKDPRPWYTGYSVLPWDPLTRQGDVL